MPPYEILWYPWTLEEEIMLAYFASRGFELPDVVQIMAYKLHRSARSPRQCINHMERLNQRQAQRGLPSLCTRGMANWNRLAVDDFLIHSTSDADLLQNLLWFRPQYMPLLRTWIEEGILDEVLNVRDLHVGLAWLVEVHRRIYGYRSYHAWRPLH